MTRRNWNRSANPPLRGGPGLREENFAEYSGERLHHSTYIIGDGSAPYRMGFHVTNGPRIVSRTGAFGVTVPSEMPLALNGDTPAVPVRFLAVPMAVTVEYISTTAAAKTVTVRVFGLNQFGKPVREDIAMALDGIGQFYGAAGRRIFMTVDRAQIIAVTGAATLDTVSIGQSMQFNPILGLPVHIRHADDVAAVNFTEIQAGVLGNTTDMRISNDLGQFVSVVENSLNMTGAGIIFDDGNRYFCQMLIRQSRGTGESSNAIGTIRRF